MRIAILTTELPEANFLTEAVLRNYPEQVVGILQSTAIVPGKSTWEAVKYLGRRMGPAPLLWMGMSKAMLRLASVYSRATFREPKTDTLQRLCKRFSTDLVSCKRLDNAARNQLTAWQPDLLVSIYFNQVLRSKVLAIPKHGAINFHPSLLPANRGLLPCHWVLGNGNRETGVSVHWVDAELDTGQVISQQTIPIEKDDSVLSLSYRCAHIGADLLVGAIARIKENVAESAPQPTEGVSYYSWPDRACIRRLQQRGHTLGSVSEMWRKFAA